MTLRCRGREVRFPRRPLVMGIVNITSDSFCGDGSLDPEAALEKAARLAAQGADIIDAGGESARTNRGPVSVEEEVRRVEPFIRGFERAVAAAAPRDAEQVWPPLLSLNTWRPEAAAALLAAGGDILNDMGGLPDDRNARLCAECGAALLIMHTLAPPKVPMGGTRYGDVVAEVEAFFRRKLEEARAAGLEEERVIFDPGIDFAKDAPDNLRLLAAVPRLAALGRPLLLPVSRKTVIGDVLGLPDPNERDPGTVACVASGLLDGAAVFRVHNVEAVWRAVKVCHAVVSAGAGKGGAA